MRDFNLTVFAHGSTAFAAIALGMLLPNAAQAQIVAATSHAKAQDDNGVLPDIVVTATRREESQQKVPISTAVIAPKQLSAIFSAGGDVRALANTVPGLEIEGSNGRTFPRFYIRGYGNTDFTGFASQPVSLVYDDVVEENPVLKGFPIFDVADVQVIRGPQGTLFGRNAPAGVVQVISAKPLLDTTSGEISGSDGTYNTANVEGWINIPVSSTVALRLSAQEQHRDAWDTSLVSGAKSEGYDDIAWRAQLLYKPSTDFTALFNVHGRSLHGSSEMFRANIFTPGTNNLVPGFNPEVNYTDGANRQNYSGVGGSARLTWNVGSITLNSVSGVESILKYFSLGDIDGGYGAAYLPTMGPTVTAANGQILGIPFPVETAADVKHHIQLTQELRAESNSGGSLNWLAGVYFFHENVAIGNYDYDMLGTYVTDDNVARQINDAGAVFGSVSYKPVEALEIRAGLRFTYDHKRFDVVDAFNQTFASTSETATGKNLSGDLSGTYTLTPDVNLYARAARGFRAPSFGAPSATVPIQVAKSEVATSEEVGFKSYIADRHVRLNADIYHYIVQNQQISAVGGSDNSVRLLNAKQSEGYGAEVDVQANLARHLIASVAGSYSFTKIQDPTISVGVCYSCTVLNPLTPAGNALIDGNPLPQAPRYTVDASLDYTVPVSDKTEAFFYGDLAYRSSINFLLYKSKEFVGQPLTELGLRAGLHFDDKRYEVAVFCRNCLNEIRAIGALDFDNLAGFVNDPRIIGVQASAKF